MRVISIFKDMAMAGLGLGIVIIGFGGCVAVSPDATEVGSLYPGETLPQRLQ
jgi:hypothetical protein